MNRCEGLEKKPSNVLSQEHKQLLPGVRFRTIPLTEILEDVNGGGIGIGVSDIMHNFTHAIYDLSLFAYTLYSDASGPAVTARRDALRTAAKLVESTGELIGSPHEHRLPIR